MKLNLSSVVCSILLLCVTSTFSQEYSYLKPKVEGSGLGTGSGPGTDDEDGKLPSRPKQSTSRRPPSRQTTPRSRSPSSYNKLPRDQGSGLTVDAERPEPKPRTVNGPLRVLTERRKGSTLPTKLDRQCKGIQSRISQNGGKLGSFPYRPLCDDEGNFVTLQCYDQDCFCVDRKDGTVFENTRGIPSKNKNCHWVKYRLEVPLRRRNPLNHLSSTKFQQRFMDELEKVAKFIPGKKELRFIRYMIHPMYNSPNGIIVQWRTLGLDNDYRLRPELLKMFNKFQTPLGNLYLLNVTKGNGEKETYRPSEKLDGGQTADATKAGKSSNEMYSVRTGEESKTPGDDPKPASGASSSKKEKKKKMATLFEQPGIIAAIIGGGIAAFLLAILLILFCIYRIRKKDEGSYALEEPKKTPVSAAVYHSAPTREYYA